MEASLGPTTLGHPQYFNWVALLTPLENEINFKVLNGSYLYFLTFQNNLACAYADSLCHTHPVGEVEVAPKYHTVYQGAPLGLSWG